MQHLDEPKPFVRGRQMVRRTQYCVLSTENPVRLRSRLERTSFRIPRLRRGAPAGYNWTGPPGQLLSGRPRNPPEIAFKFREGRFLRRYRLFAGAQLPSLTSAMDLEPKLFVFLLATFLGLEVIRRVSPLLHTPLMSLTNAISAIVVVAAIQVTAEGSSTFSTFLGTLAVIAATTNIVGGFWITDRMLKMFRRETSQT